MKKIITSLLILSLILISLFNVPANALSLENDKIPMLKSLKQISNNQLEIEYDMAVDAQKGTMPTNYWIQSLTHRNPVGIATLGRFDKVNNENSLTNDLVEIKPTDSTNTKFILTFNSYISSGEKYKLIICYLTVPNGAPYTGDNGAKDFKGK